MVILDTHRLNNPGYMIVSLRQHTSASLSLCSTLTPIHDQIASRRSPWL